MKYLNMNSEIIEAKDELNIEFLSSEIPKALNDSLTGTKIIQNIVNSMRIFSHNSKDKQVTTEINTYIRSAVEISKNSWKHNAEVKLNLTENNPRIKINIGQINQVILNLIINASDAINSDRNKERKDNKITISSYIKDENFVISVKDTGVGISKKDKNKVFDAFFTTKEVGKGSGQGLSISYDIIVNKHNGRLYFESEHLSGTTFYIELPLFKQDTV